MDMREALHGDINLVLEINGENAKHPDSWRKGVIVYERTSHSCNIKDSKYYTTWKLLLWLI